MKDKKICTKCGIEKPIDKFRKYKRGDRYQYRGDCKICENKQKKITYKKHQKTNLEYAKKYRIENPEKTKAAQKKWELENNEYRKTYHKERRIENPKKYTKQKKDWILRNKEKHDKWRKKYYPKYNKKRRSEDLNYRLAGNLRASLKSRLKHSKKSRYNKKNDFYELIGCSIEELKIHLEKSFTSGMTWDTYGFRGWQIDHIKSCASFDLTDLKQQRECFDWENLQPLWWYDNLSKGAKVAIT